MQNKTEQKILALLREEPLGLFEISTRLGQSWTVINPSLVNLLYAGRVVVDQETLKYSIPAPPDLLV